MQNSKTIYGLLQSSYVLHTLFTLTKAGVFDFIYPSAHSLDEVSRGLNLDRSFLQTLMNIAVSFKYVEERDRVYRIAAKGRPLATQSGSWLRAALLGWGETNLPSLSNMSNQLLSGRKPTTMGREKSVWEHFKKSPDENALFIDFMHRVTLQAHAMEIVESIPIKDAKKVFDIAGGIGGLGCALAEKFSELSVVICDQPENATQARQYIDSKGLAGRCSFEGIDMLESVPAGGDLYLIKHALHDWSDEDALRILKSINKSMVGSTRLMIIEGLLDKELDDEVGGAGFVFIRDLEQQILTSGRVRSLADFGALTTKAGLRITDVRHSEIIDVSYIECQRA